MRLDVILHPQSSLELCHSAFCPLGLTELLRLSTGLVEDGITLIDKLTDYVIDRERWQNLIVLNDFMLNPL